MTGKQKLINLIENATYKEITERLLCPNTVGLDDFTLYGCAESDCEDCWKTALEKEYEEPPTNER